MRNAQLSETGAQPCGSNVTATVKNGVIASLLAQGLEPYRAAALGAYLHAKAGVLAADVFESTVSVLAGDVADALPEVYADLQSIRSWDEGEY